MTLPTCSATTKTSNRRRRDQLASTTSCRTTSRDSHAVCQEIDLHKRAARQTGDTDAGACRQMPRCEIGLVHHVHCRVVACEMGEIDTRKCDSIEPAAAAGQNAFEV